MSTKETIKSFPTRTSSHLHIEMCGMSYCDGSYKITRPGSKIHCFEYIISGSGTIHTPSGTYHPHEGDVYFLRKGEDHLYYSDEENPWVKIWFNIEGPLVDSLLAAYGITSGCRIENCAVRYLFEEFVDNANTLQRQHEIEKANSILVHKIIQVMADSIRGAAPDSPSADAINLKRFIDANFSKPITIKEIADHIYRSPSQAIRIFRNNFGITPYEYLLRQKINAAEIMLKNTVMPILQIAEQLGFKDEHYFSSVFKKRTGFTPSKFRKNNKSL